MPSIKSSQVISPSPHSWHANSCIVKTWHRGRTSMAPCRLHILCPLKTTLESASIQLQADHHFAINETARCPRECQFPNSPNTPEPVYLASIHSSDACWHARTRLQAGARMKHARIQFILGQNTISALITRSENASLDCAKLRGSMCTIQPLNTCCGSSWTGQGAFQLPDISSLFAQSFLYQNLRIVVRRFQSFSQKDGGNYANDLTNHDTHLFHRLNWTQQ